MIEWSIGGCKIRLHFLFLAVLGVVLFTDLRQTALQGIFGVAIHESGHLLTMVLCGIPPAQVVIQPFGVLIYERDSAAKSCLRQGLVSLGGPLANGLAVVFVLLARQLWPVDWSSFLLVNGGLGLFNCLPVESLDGGRALYAFLSIRCSPNTASRLVTVVSIVVLIPMAVLGFLFLLQSRYNFTLLLVSVYLMLCLVLKNSR